MNQDKIWEYHQLKVNESESVFSASNQRYEYLASKLSRGSRVLNVGVGLGGMERLLIDKGCDVFCLDPTKGAIEKMRTTLHMGERAQTGYSEKMPFEDDQFDAVVMSEVMEHLDDDVLDRSLGEVVRVLRKGALFIGTVPADENLADSLCVCPSCGERFHRWGHVQTFSRERLQTFLSQRLGNLVIERHYFSEVGNLNWKGRLLRYLKLLLLRLGGSGTNESFFFSGRNL